MSKNSPEIEIKIGPYSILQDAIANNSQVLISCRNNKKLLARVRSFDFHMNLLLENVLELWREDIRKDKGKSKSRSIYKERFISKMLLRGDSIILIVKNPQTV